MEHVKMMQSVQEKCQTLRVDDCPKMENALDIRFMQERSKHTSISGDTLKAKAIKKLLNKKIFIAVLGG